MGEVTSPSSDTMCHSCAPVLYTNQSIWICNVEMILHICCIRTPKRICCVRTPKRIWKKLWQPFILKLPRFTAHKPWVFGHGFLLEQRSVRRTAEHTKRCRFFWTPCIYFILMEWFYTIITSTRSTGTFSMDLRCRYSNRIHHWYGGRASTPT